MAAEHAHEQLDTGSTSGNPVLWTVALVGFVAVAATWFSYMLGKGWLVGKQHPLQVSTAPTGPGEPDHAAFIKRMAEGDEELRKTGKRVYASRCTSCHGTDGGPGINADARVFNSEDFKNGTDPYSMYLTIVEGYGLMPAQMRPSEATEVYAVLHYVREEFLQPNNEANLFQIDDEYLASAPWPDPSAGGDAQEARPSPAELARRALPIPVEGAMASMARGASDDSKVQAARRAFLRTAQQLSPELRDSLRSLAEREAAGAFIKELYASARADDAVDFVQLISDPGRNHFQPRLALLSGAELKDLADRLRKQAGEGEAP